MEIIKTSITDLIILKPKIHNDERGYFFEAYNDKWFKDNFSNINFIQDNESESFYGVLRGLHFQNPPFAQTKLVRVIKGKVLDVAVDIRKESSTFSKHESVILSSDNNKQFLIPKGFAHGFLVISKTAIISYKVDNIYAPEYDSGLLWNDLALNIDWLIPEKDIFVSSKDSMHSKFNEFKFPF